MWIWQTGFIILLHDLKSSLFILHPAFSWTKAGCLSPLRPILYTFMRLALALAKVEKSDLVEISRPVHGDCQLIEQYSAANVKAIGQGRMDSEVTKEQPDFTCLYKTYIIDFLPLML